MTVVPPPNFAHLLSLSGPYGTFEHANHARAREEHGYCTDDVARVLLVTSREGDASYQVGQLAWSSLDFLRCAQGLDGKFKNRRAPSGRWLGSATDEDCWGRAVWALGTVIARSSDEQLVMVATRILERSLGVISPWPRAMAFGTLGAAEVLQSDPAHEGALALVANAAAILDRPEHSPYWRWSEDRLTYANAALPEAMMVAGSILGDDRLVQRALRQLEWLLELSSCEGHLSATPAGGRSPDETAEKYDQQPIEVAALSEACLRAYTLTGDGEWIKGHQLCVQWFLGENDGDAEMFCAATGGGYDGLTAVGPNLNQGAESTVALLTTLQQARHLQMAP